MRTYVNERQVSGLKRTRFKIHEYKRLDGATGLV